MTRVKELADIYKVPGMLTAHEVDCLFQLGQIDHCDGEDTRAEFFANIKRGRADSQVMPMIMTSEMAADGWTKPIRLLWIDGDHRYERAQLDFKL
jgi:hypothetical protein